MPRRQPRSDDRDATAAMKAGLEQLARSRGITGSSYPACLRLYADIRDEAERWVVKGVRAAIEAGCTWAQVGEGLGVSRQAAHERYAPLITAAAAQVVEAD